MRISDWSSDVCSSDLRIVAQQFRRGDGDFPDLRPVHLEDDVAPCGRHGVVDVDDGLLRAAQGFEGGGDQIGRASCRARVCQSVSISVVAETLKKKYSLQCTSNEQHQ